MEVTHIIPLYILGLLLRFGPQHGYQIKKLMEEQLADFTQIKLPTIYYHLEKMEAAGFLMAQTGQDSARPEKTIYSISEDGIAQFHTLLERQLDMQYRPTFDVDAAFYFSDHLSTQALLESLARHIQQLRASLAHIEEHRAQTVPYMPQMMRPYADIIFEHHAAHYRAEVSWAQGAIKTIEEANHDDEIQGN